MQTRVAITGVGMVTAVGPTAERTCAAVRCGIARFGEAKSVVDRFGEAIIVARPVVGNPEDDRATRCADLSARACRQALEDLGADAVRQRPVDLFLLTSDTAPSIEMGRTEGAVRALLAEAGEISLETIQLGNAAGMMAVQQACRRIADDPRRLALIVGYDNLADAGSLAKLESAHRLKSASRPRGVIPGEAAACVALEDDSFASAGRPAYASVTAAATAHEDFPIGNPQPCLATALTYVINAGLKTAGWSGEMIHRVYCDLNGEEYRAHEWMLALSRTAVQSRPTHPADCIGDVGASFSPLLMGAAAIAFRRGYAKTDKVLVFCSSVSGLRGAICLFSPGGETGR